MLQPPGVLITLLFIAQSSVICQSKSDGECFAKPSGLKVSLSSQKNHIGNWITKVGLVRGGGRGLTDTMKTDPWLLDVDSNTSSCEGAWSTLGVTLTITAPLPKVKDDYELFPGVGFYKFHTDATTWPLARQICADEDAHLVIINSEKESDVTKTLFARYPTIPGASHADYAWIGVERKASSYWTIFGDDLNSTGFTRWDPGNPKRGIKDNCLLVHRPSGGIHDVICDWKVAYICEHEL